MEERKEHEILNFIFYGMLFQIISTYAFGCWNTVAVGLTTSAPLG
jgi:hypothetical protein